MAAACALECGRLGLAWVLRLGPDVLALHDERVVLKVTVAAGDDNEKADHGDCGVGVPHKRGV